MGDPVVIKWILPPSASKEQAGQACKLSGQIMRVSQAAGSDGFMELGIRFNGLISEQLEEARNSWHRGIIALVLVAVAALIIGLKSRNVVSFWYQPEFQIYSLAAALYVLSRGVIALFYKPPRDNGYMPAISVIVAVKNEEANITATIEHCLNARYPEDLVEVLVIDDGSNDKTWEVLQDCEKKFERLRCFKFEENRGKRHAMALGTRKAKGKILIFIDSDSNVEPEGFYRIVQPFADKRVGAVAGHTDVIPGQTTFISKMETVRYFVAQRVIKASEGVFNAVTCCPGPFSAYRRDAVMNVLDAWEFQKFLGQPATFGDDRSLTNFILRDYYVQYHSDARCATYTPDTWMVFFRQQLRWKKSWFRETWIAVRFMWQKHPAAVLAYYIGVLITLVSPFVLIRAMFYMPLVLGSFSFAPYIGGLLLIYAFFGLIYYYFTRGRGWYYGMAFALIYIAVLSIQNYYALLTVNKNHWGTR